jgi:hypothetical protein
MRKRGHTIVAKKNKGMAVEGMMFKEQMIKAHCAICERPIMKVGLKEKEAETDRKPIVCGECAFAMHEGV